MFCLSLSKDSQANGMTPDFLLINPNRSLDRNRRVIREFVFLSTQNHHFTNVDSGPMYERFKPPKSSTTFCKTVPGSPQMTRSLW